MPKHFQIDALLTSRQLARLHAFCAERLRTIDQVHAFVKRQGVDVSRGAVHSWKRNHEGTPARFARATTSVATAFPLAAPLSDAALRNRIAEMLAGLATRPALEAVASTVGQLLAVEIGRLKIRLGSPISRSACGKPIGRLAIPAEMLRRFKVICNRAEKIGRHERVCPLCGNCVEVLDRHLKRDHVKQIAAMPPEAFL